MKIYIGKLFVFFVLLLGCAMARLVFAADTTTFTPTVISVSDSSASEISNPFRGAYSWRNTAPQPATRNP